MGWLSDLFRLVWGLVYWNARKSAYRLRKAQGRCPCQHPSDSGRAYETGCAAMIHWNQPKRFQRLCPLLQQTPAGPWRCSVNRTEVRPFWGRALGFYGGAFLTVYLTATLGAFLAFSSIGYKVTYAGVVWPPAWSKFHGIRINYFQDQYRTAVASGHLDQALASLSTIYNLEPQNYGAGRQLAQLRQVTYPGLSDGIYARLINDHPAQAEITAQAWFRALLTRGNFNGVENLAATRIAAEPQRVAAWFNAFLFANRRTGDTKLLAALIKQTELPSWTTRLLTLTADLRTASHEDARRLLVAAADEAGDAYSFFQVCRELITRGFAREALTVMDRRAGLLGTRDSVSLRLDALATIGWDTTRRSEVESLLVANPTPVVVELLSAHLIRFPNDSLRNLLFARLEQNPLPAAGDNYSAFLSLFFAAGAGRDKVQLDWSATRIRSAVHGEYKSLDTIISNLMGDLKKTRIENYLPALQPIPLEITYALFDHYDPVGPTIPATP